MGPGEEAPPAEASIHRIDVLERAPARCCEPKVTQRPEAVTPYRGASCLAGKLVGDELETRDHGADSDPEGGGEKPACDGEERSPGAPREIEEEGASGGRDRDSRGREREHEAEADEGDPEPPHRRPGFRF